MCPHGTGPASLCSQCLGIKPRVVTVDKGVIKIDGVEHGTLEGINRERQAEETEKTLSNKRRRCGRCGTVGHYAATCWKKLPVADDGPASFDDLEIN